MTGLARRATLLALLLSVTGMLLTIAALPILMTTVFQAVDQSLVLVAIAIVPFTYVFTFGNAILTGRQRVTVYGAIALGQVVLALVLFLVLMGVLGLGVGGAILAYLVYSAVGALAVAIAAFRTPQDGVVAEPAPIRSLFNYGLRLYPASLSGFFSYRADVYLLALLGTSAANLGLYSIAVGLAELLFFLPDSVVTVFFPHVAGGSRAEADGQAGVVTRVTIAATGLAALPLAVAAVIAVNVILPAYVGSLPALFVLMPGVVMLSASKTLTAYLNGIGRGGIVSMTALTSLAANIALNLVLIPSFGIVGAAAASLFSYSLGATLQLIICSRLTGRTALEFLVPTREDIRQLRERAAAVLRRIRSRRRPSEARP
jgi:O-antigen/teichoic acid export membrane protein